jgi:hemoglobin
MTTLYEEIGGAPALHAAVTLFYEKVLADGRIAHFFAGVNMARQAAAQERFLASVLQGTAQDPAGYMHRAHRRLELNDSHFDAVAEHLAATLNELGVAGALVEQIMGAVGGLRDAVLGRDQPEALRTPA